MCPREKVTRINKMITPGKINALIIAVKFSLLTIKNESVTGQCATPLCMSGFVLVVVVFFKILNIRSTPTPTV